MHRESRNKAEELIHIRTKGDRNKWRKTEGSKKRETKKDKNEEREQQRM